LCDILNCFSVALLVGVMEDEEGCGTQNICPVPEMLSWIFHLPFPAVW